MPAKLINLIFTIVCTCSCLSTQGLKSGSVSKNFYAFIDMDKLSELPVMIQHELIVPRASMRMQIVCLPKLMEASSLHARFVASGFASFDALPTVVLQPQPDLPFIPAVL